MGRFWDRLAFAIAVLKVPAVPMLLVSACRIVFEIHHIFGTHEFYDHASGPLIAFPGRGFCYGAVL